MRRRKYLLVFIPAVLFAINMLLVISFTLIEGDDGGVFKPWIFEDKPLERSNVTAVGEEELMMRQEKVRDAYQYAFNSYKKYAWGKDELTPNKRSGYDWLGMGITIVDSMDTMYIMGLMEEFNISRDWVLNNLNFKENDLDISLFETTIRVVGGLLSVYDLTGDELFLQKASELGDLLLPAWDTPSGFPGRWFNLKSGKGTAGWWREASSLADVGTTQMEFATLATITKNIKYATKSLKVYDMLDKMDKVDGLYPILIDSKTGEFETESNWYKSKWHDMWSDIKIGPITIGGGADSYFEYLLKLWILSGKTDKQYQRMYLEATDAIIANLTKVSDKSGLAFVVQQERGRTINNMDHLSCFAGAMFALGAYHNVTTETAKHLQLGVDLTNTCHEFYKRQVTGLSPDYVHFRQNEDFNILIKEYILRPETVESYFVLYWITGDPIYQEWGWDFFQAIEKYCRTNNGYSGIEDVTKEKVKINDLQNSFFLAETLKYAYLLFSPRDTISLDKWVFNTEAHPLKVW